MSFNLQNFEIHITNEDPRQDTKVQAFLRRKSKYSVRKSIEGKSVENVRLAVFSLENDAIRRIKSDEDIRDQFMNSDEELDIEIAGKKVGRTSGLLMDNKDELCYNFVEYEIKRTRDGKIIPCEVCGGIQCEHRIKKQTESNINLDEKPVTWIKPVMIDKLTAIKKWSFEKSFQLRHTDGLTYNHLYNMAKKLHEENKLVLMAVITNGKPDTLVLRNSGKPFYAFLEGRIRGEEYALILHQTRLKLGE